MITTILASLALSQTGGWVATSLTPTVIARRVDDRLATLAKATVSYQFTYFRPDSHPDAGRAAAACVGHIVGPGKFWLQVPHLDFKRRDPLNYQIWIADGKRFSSVIDPADPMPVPIARRPAPPAGPAGVWFKDFSSVILSGLGRPSHALEGFVADAQRRGFKVVSQTRTIVFQKRKLTSHRIVALKGPIRYEIVIDGRGNLPVSVTNTIGTTQSSRWTAVDWNLKPGKNLNAKAISFRKKAPAPGL